MDPKTNKRRGFVFITFKEEETVKKVVEKKYHNVSGTKDTNGKEGLVSVSRVKFSLNLLIDVKSSGLFAIWHCATYLINHFSESDVAKYGNPYSELVLCI